jgi:hypothetical protein
MRKGFWHKAYVKIIKLAAGAASEDWPALTECLLCAKFYAKPFTCIHSHKHPMLEVTIFMLEVIQIWQHLTDCHERKIFTK